METFVRNLWEVVGLSNFIDSVCNRSREFSGAIVVRGSSTSNTILNPEVEIVIWGSDRTEVLRKTVMLISTSDLREASDEVHKLLDPVAKSQKDDLVKRIEILQKELEKL